MCGALHSERSLSDALKVWHMAAAGAELAALGMGVLVAALLLLLLDLHRQVHVLAVTERRRLGVFALHG